MQITKDREEKKEFERRFEANQEFDDTFDKMEKNIQKASRLFLRNASDIQFLLTAL